MADKKDDAWGDNLMPTPPQSNTLKSGTMKGKDGHAQFLLVRRDKSGRVVAKPWSQKIQASSILSSRGQVVIPSEIRDTLKADKGDRVIFRVLDDHTLVVRIEKKPTSDDLFGFLQAKVPPEMRNRNWDELREIAKRKKADEYLTKGLE